MEHINYNSIDFNTINIYGVIDTEKAERVINQLQYLDYKFKKEKVPFKERIITIQINSVGGSVTDGLAIYDTMNNVDCYIRTIAIGTASSMGAFLLSSGSKGMRFATENAEILIHQPLGGAQGQATEIIIAAKHIEKVRNRLNALLAFNTNQPVEKIANDTERDTILDAYEAKEYGIVDEVIKSERK